MVQKKPLIIFFEVAVLQTQTNDKSLSALYQKQHFNMKMVANGSYAELDIPYCLL